MNYKTYLTQWSSENDVSARRSNVASASCDLCLWPPNSRKLIVSCPFPMHEPPLCQFAARSVNSFSKYRDHNFGDGRYERTDGRKDKRTTMTPSATLGQKSVVFRLCMVALRAWWSETFWYFQVWNLFWLMSSSSFIHSSWLMWCKNYWNRPRFAKAVATSLLPRFYGPRSVGLDVTCILLYSQNS